MMLLMMFVPLLVVALARARRSAFEHRVYCCAAAAEAFSHVHDNNDVCVNGCVWQRGGRSSPAGPANHEATATPRLGGVSRGAAGADGVRLESGGHAAYWHNERARAFALHARGASKLQEHWAS